MGQLEMGREGPGCQRWDPECAEVLTLSWAATHLALQLGTGTIGAVVDVGELGRCGWKRAGKGPLSALGCRTEGCSPCTPLLPVWHCSWERARFAVAVDKRELGCCDWKWWAQFSVPGCRMRTLCTTACCSSSVSSIYRSPARFGAAGMVWSGGYHGELWLEIGGNGRSFQCKDAGWKAAELTFCAAAACCSSSVSSVFFFFFFKQDDGIAVSI